MTRIVVLNVGGTSTKVALFDGEELKVQDNLPMSQQLAIELGDLWNQYHHRRQTLLDWLDKQNFSPLDCGAIVSRGAPVKPMQSGVYRINQAMIDDATSRQYGNHPCSVGCKIAFDLGTEWDIPAYTVDTPSVDELWPYARYTGRPEMERKSYFQALNQKAVGRRLAADLGKPYDSLRAVVTHIGSGLSIAAHCEGKVIDVNNGLDGDGPMAPERAGTVPAGSLLALACSGKYEYQEIYRMINGQGGLYAHLGTKDCVEIEKRIQEGDEKAREAYCAMAYQIGKEIGGCACALEGKIDALAFTGGLANSRYLMAEIDRWVSWIAPLHYYPGEDELSALQKGAALALAGQVPVHEYA